MKKNFVKVIAAATLLAVSLVFMGCPATEDDNKGGGGTNTVTAIVYGTATTADINLALTKSNEVVLYGVTIGDPGIITVSGKTLKLVGVITLDDGTVIDAANGTINIDEIVSLSDTSGTSVVIVGSATAATALQAVPNAGNSPIVPAYLASLTLSSTTADLGVPTYVPSVTVTNNTDVGYLATAATSETVYVGTLNSAATTLDLGSADVSASLVNLTGAAVTFDPGAAVINNLTATGDLTLGDDTTITGTLTAPSLIVDSSKKAIVGGDVKVTGNVTLGTTTTTDALTVNGKATIGGTLTVGAGSIITIDGGTAASPSTITGAIVQAVNAAEIAGTGYVALAAAPTGTGSLTISNTAGVELKDDLAFSTKTIVLGTNGKLIVGASKAITGANFVLASGTYTGLGTNGVTISDAGGFATGASANDGILIGSGSAGIKYIADDGNAQALVLAASDDGNGKVTFASESDGTATITAAADGTGTAGASITVGDGTNPSTLELLGASTINLENGGSAKHAFLVLKEGTTLKLAATSKFATGATIDGSGLTIGVTAAANLAVLTGFTANNATAGNLLTLTTETANINTASAYVIGNATALINNVASTGTPASAVSTTVAGTAGAGQIKAGTGSAILITGKQS